ncbi:S8 family serine peptidase [Methanofollis formosanus]|uniref:S8 family serine peptidase n=1 Tax=Methanofollis formosanus TaxID=299308 RepID=UPI001C7D1229|nr:S8 family serine peptidase [Methanofollis formosanus]
MTAGFVRVPALLFVAMVILCCPALAHGAGLQDGTAGEASLAQAGDQGSDLWISMRNESRTFKSGLSPAEEKLPTELVQVVRDGQEHGPAMTTRAAPPAAAFVPALPRTSTAHTDDGTFQVYVYVWLNEGVPTDVVDPYGEVTDRDEERYVAAAWVRTDRLGDLASLEDVRRIESVTPPAVYAGSVASESDVILKTAAVRKETGYGGEGMKVGIVSDSADQWREAVASGDLPPTVQILYDIDGIDEGTAMLEVVHDTAPGADLFFHSGWTNKLTFVTAISALVGAGCDVICDDIGWFDEPYFEDGYVASYVHEVVENEDLVYISAAGNDALGHYEGPFRDDGRGYHLFSEGSNLIRAVVEPPAEGMQTMPLQIFLQWDEPWGSASSDYDLFLVTREGNRFVEIANSSQVQDGDDVPMEEIAVEYFGDEPGVVYLSVALQDGEPCTLEIFILTGGFFDDQAATPEGAIFGHPAVPGVVAVGAVRADDPTEIEIFSSEGPATVTRPELEVRPKPDICGVDRTRISGVGEFGNTFFGTSAAAPAVAGVVATVWGINRDTSPAGVRKVLYETAVDLGEPGWDPVYGHGRADALSMFDALAAPPANLSLSFVPTSAEVRAGEEMEVDLVIDRTPAALLEYHITANLSDPAVGEITGVSFPGWVQHEEHTALPDDTVRINATGQPPRSQPDGVALCTLTVRGDAAGTTAVTADPDSRVIGPGEGEYVLEVAPGCITVMSAPIRPFPRPDGGTYPLPTDPDGDGLYEDVNGDSVLTMEDVTLYAGNLRFIRDRQPLEAFDFDKNGRIGFSDVNTLYSMVQR